MKVEDIVLDKQLYAFELDDILFPRQDYLLQVYYLFGSFYEFTEGTTKASELANFMKKVYQFHGEEKVFDTAKEVFGIDEKYRENLERLQANAQIPLRLEIYPDKLSLLKQLFESEKNIAILTKGNPVEQINKLKFLDWGELAPFKHQVRVFFVDELRYQKIEIIPYLAGEYNISEDNILLIV
jgi:FMN phosphatase YigB (HAD superfamily)